MLPPVRYWSQRATIKLEIFKNIEVKLLHADRQPRRHLVVFQE
jgi:hypothetical protein